MYHERMKQYTISRDLHGNLSLLCEAEIPELRNGKKTGRLLVLNHAESAKEVSDFAPSIMCHYYGASPTDPGATAEAKRKTIPFMEGFLLSANIPPGGKLEISSEVIDKFMELQ